VWQELYEELKDGDFTILTVALDRCADDPRPYIEKANPSHPSLIDTEHQVADLYGIINVSTVVWINEEGRVVRPTAIEYGSNMFQQFHGIDCEPFLDAVRAWVREGTVDTGERVGVMPPSAEEQLARAEFSLAWHLHQQGHEEAAESHFVRAGELSPYDWTIRRGSMPIRGQNPMGPEFFELAKEWDAAGKPSYASEAARRA
jgi:hypothetical protein